MSFLCELWMYKRERKEIWLLPIVSRMVFLDGLVVLRPGYAVAPKIYTIF